MEEENLKKLALEILEKSYVLSLGIADGDGVWVADVLFTWDDDLNMYWMSTPARRHSRAIDGNYPDVAGTITATTGPDDFDAGLQLSGMAKQVKEIPWQSVLRYTRKRKKPDPKTGEDILGEHRWYQCVPDRIELLYGKKFGYIRQKVR